MRYDITGLPANMRSKIALTPPPRPDLADHCWTWQNATSKQGSGCFAIDSKSRLAHRVAYEKLVGPVPDDLQIDHLCRNRKCCNPAHLEPVTHLENARRGERAQRTHCARGHELSGQNLIASTPKGRHPRRECRACRLRRDSASRHKRKVAAS